MTSAEMESKGMGKRTGTGVIMGERVATRMMFQVPCNETFLEN
jgi:hypothetical protein